MLYRVTEDKLVSLEFEVDADSVQEAIDSVKKGYGRKVGESGQTRHHAESRSEESLLSCPYSQEED